MRRDSKMSELISVIMSVYNEKSEWLRQAIESILNQTYENFEYIIILDNPNAKELETILAEYAQKDSRVSYYVNTKNVGLVESLNKGIKKSSGTLIARMDADDIAFKDRFEKELQDLKKEDADFVFASRDYIDENGMIHTGEKATAYNSKQIEKITKYGNVAIHSTWFVKRKVYDVLGGYRNISFCEDYEFLIRALQSGFKIYKSEEKVGYTRIRNNSISMNNALIQFEKSNYLRKQFRLGKCISDINEDEINKIDYEWGENEKKAYIAAKNEMVEFCYKLYQHKYIDCVKDTLKNWIKSKWYRIIFLNNIQCRCVMLYVGLREGIKRLRRDSTNSRSNT